MDALEDLDSGALVFNDAVEEGQGVVLQGGVRLSHVHDLEEDSNKGGSLVLVLFLIKDFALCISAFSFIAQVLVVRNDLIGVVGELISGLISLDLFVVNIFLGFDHAVPLLGLVPEIAGVHDWLVWDELFVLHLYLVGSY